METPKGLDADKALSEIEFVCADCKKHTPKGEAQENDRKESICENCSHDYFTCEDCDKLTHHDEGYSINDGSYYVCEDCYDSDYFSCDDCGLRLNNDEYAQDGYCNECYRNREDEDSSDSFYRDYHTGDTYTTKGKRAFSCEIECYYPDYDTMESVYEDMPSGVGVSDDGSLSNKGKEFQTPKLSGKKGEKVLKELCDLLGKNDFYVNKSCGLHIHLDTEDYHGDLNKLKKLILFYLNFEPVIYSYLPYSRRKNTYCLPLSSFYHEAEITEAQSVEELEQIWYREQDLEKIKQRKSNGHDSTRYAGVNLHSLLSNGHIELRHHSGTIDYDKIRNWIKLHETILDTISTKNVAWEALKEAKYILTLEGKQEKMFQLLGLPKKLEAYLTARAEKFGNVVKEETPCVE